MYGDLLSADSFQLGWVLNNNRNSKQGGVRLHHRKKEATYQEITQEILKRYFDGLKDKTKKDDARDIRVARNVERRVYEVLNVMAAANIVSKDNKTVRFIGASVNASNT
ncbi:hypothetical protein QR680_000396 [Steinernema hermaphroditum]|uniref:E2F/DP family winged-helix DNA-binding domain-containing protein n=1 Tax=Steinernema hermaphroditum TaxID=289476 RepID=A0AA39GVB3_9BILA|nr:hypothetical protein QR680_000396 [Steinernema hermaphroditum]